MKDDQDAPQTTKPRLDWLGEIAVPLSLPFLLAGAILLVVALKPRTHSASVPAPHASAELCYAYYVWAEQAHDKSPGMERECSKP